jgi:hypothetical protein
MDGRFRSLSGNLRRCQTRGGFRLSVVSCQWSVVSGQWAVGGGRWAVGRWAVGGGQVGRWAGGQVGRWAVGGGRWIRNEEAIVTD